MQLTIKGGKREVKMLKPELHKLRSAQDVLDGLEQLVDDDTESDVAECRRLLAAILTRHGGNGSAE